MAALLNRRSFLKTGVPVPIILPVIIRAQSIVERGRFSERDVPYACDQLLKLVNAERASLALSSLQLDDLACKVATEHALDLAQGGFLGHWSRDGRKPYHRYSFAGGTDGVQENDSAAENIQSISADGVLRDLHDMHTSMFREVPPNDGHRKTILFPHHTHVGFGIALSERRLRLVELYLAHYVQLNPFVAQGKPKSNVLVTGHLLNAKHFLNHVSVYYEPLPTPPELSWLQTPRSVSLPDEFQRLRPQTPAGARYADGGTGDFEWDREGKFRVKIRLFKDEPGIYTAVFWVRRVPADKGFAGAQVCIVSH